jgi:hypothetical protein
MGAEDGIQFDPLERPQGSLAQMNTSEKMPDGQALPTEPDQSGPTYSLWQMILYALRLRTLGFGRPVAQEARQAPQRRRVRGRRDCGRDRNYYWRRDRNREAIDYRYCDSTIGAGDSVADLEVQEAARASNCGCGGIDWIGGLPAH